MMNKLKVEERLQLALNSSNLHERLRVLKEIHRAVKAERKASMQVLIDRTLDDIQSLSV